MLQHTVAEGKFCSQAYIGLSEVNNEEACSLRLWLATGIFLLSSASLAKVTSLPVHRAVERGQVQLVRQLITAGVDVIQEDEAGRIPFELALELGNDVLAALLLQATVGIAGQDEKGWTPLHFAVLSETEWLVREFIQAGASVWGGRGQNVFDVAAMMNSEAMLLRVLAEEDKLTNRVAWKNDNSLRDLIAQRNLGDKLRDILADTPNFACYQPCPISTARR